MFRRKPISPAEKVKRKLEHIERENEASVKNDHRFGVIGVVTIAIAALVGMSYEAVSALVHGQIDANKAVQLAVALVAVFVMNRALLAAARNIRRAEARGEAARPRDIATMYGVMLIESISFGYMLSLFEDPQSLIQWTLLFARSGVLPYTVVYLEQQREMPLDPIDIAIQTEIGQGLGVMNDLVTQSYEAEIPTALKVQNYRANAAMSPEMDARLVRMAEAANAIQTYKQTGQIVLVNKHGDPLKTPGKTGSVSIQGESTAPKDENPIERIRRKIGRKSPKKGPDTTPEQRQAELLERLKAGDDLSVSKVRKLFKIAQGTAYKDLQAARQALSIEQGDIVAYSDRKRA